jgi:hypothetical protein
MQSSLRAATCWLLLSILSGVLPAACAGANPADVTDAARNAALAAAMPDPAAQDSAPQQATVPTPAPAPLKRHHTWTWVAVIAAVAVGAGVAIIATNRQSGKTSTTTSGATVGVGSPSVGAP